MALAWAAGVRIAALLFARTSGDAFLTAADYSGSELGPVRCSEWGARRRADVVTDLTVERPKLIEVSLLD